VLPSENNSTKMDRHILKIPAKITTQETYQINLPPSWTVLFSCQLPNLILVHINRTLLEQQKCMSEWNKFLEVEEVFACIWLEPELHISYMHLNENQLTFVRGIWRRSTKWTHSRQSPTSSCTSVVSGTYEKRSYWRTTYFRIDLICEFITLHSWHF
jgi:hypothetical protein